MEGTTVGSAPLAEQTTVLAPPLQAPESPSYEPPVQQRNSNTVIYAVASLVVLLALAAVGVVLLVNNSSGNSGQPTNNPLTNPTISTSPNGGTTPNSGSTSSQTNAPMPAGGTLCPGLLKGKYQFGILGTNTSCGFVQAVYNAWESSGNQSPVTAMSPTTHVTYSNIVCTVDATASWATCVGGRNNTARMFFALP